jgi:hypothetical protein
MFLAALRPNSNAQTETSSSNVTPMIKPICSTKLVPRQVVRFSASDSTASGRLGQRHGSRPDCRGTHLELRPDLIQFKIPLQAAKAIKR